jgi:hypothetical protein
MIVRQRRSLISSLAIFALLLLGGTLASVATAEFEDFDIESLAGDLSTPVAGERPDLTMKFSFKHRVNVEGRHIASARVENASLRFPPGLVGNPLVVPRCKTGEFVAKGQCPIDSQVGVSRILLSDRSLGEEFTAPLYNLEPPHPEREIARLGFFAGVAPVFVDISIRTGGDYGLTAVVRDAPGIEPILSATTTIWGNPADPSHDEQRLTNEEANLCPLGTACKAPGGKRSSGIEDPRAFLTNPSACQEQAIGLSVTSYQLPGQVFTATAPMEPIINCEGLPFEPTLEVQPTTSRAGAPTGLRTVIRIPQHEEPGERGTSTMRDAKVTLPDGMTISASAAYGLQACSEEEVGFRREVAAQCPDASKLGSATIVSSALAQPLHGEIYQRTPAPGHQFGLWLVMDELGLHVKLPGEVIGDPRTGQLTAHFADLPQLPVQEVVLDFWGGPRAPLKNPDVCGIHQASFVFKPWSNDPSASGQTPITIDEGCGVGFSPKLDAGVTRPIAGRFSPLIVALTREDAEDNIEGLDVELPQGELAKLRGVPLCPEEAASIGTCPAESRIGSVVVAAGAGPAPLWIPQPGKAPAAVYLAGPYQGAPYSLVSVVPAQAGPFDLGTVAVRSGIFIHPETGKVTVKTTLPLVLEGATILYRTIHVVIDRPRFALNPTDCREMAVEAIVIGAHGATASPRDRFQVGGCKALEFKPQLSLALRGGTRRGDYPGLTASLQARRKDANIARVSVALPHSQFLAQQHIGTICTRVRFARNNCPKRSVYGYAKAWTPLLSKPLKGPVYLRSSDHTLPDLVAHLGGQIDIDLVGRIDSYKGGIRTTFEAVPDAPVRKFVLRMKGGVRGLLQNSENICQSVHRASVKMVAQNGRRVLSRPRLELPCGKQ